MGHLLCGVSAGLTRKQAENDQCCLFCSSKGGNSLYGYEIHPLLIKSMSKNRTDSGIRLPWKALFYTHIVKWIEMLLFCAPDQ